ncbi:MAG TPA: transglycosylase SLT domain-containing protein [Longimicrobiales bacterium]|nr:transglycosylase SLT domain-containing protein [Longimicrobiales bacterium]
MTDAIRNNAAIALLLLILPTCGSAEMNDAREAPAGADAVSGDTAALRAAVAEVRAGLEHSVALRPDAAAAAYARATELVPSFADWAALLAAGAAARAGDSVAVRTHLGRADAALAQQWGWRYRVNALAAAGDTLGAARLAERIATELDQPARVAEAWLRAGMLQHSLRRTVAATAAFRRAIDTSVAAGASIDAAGTLGTMGTPAAEDQLRIGRVFLHHSNPTRAATAFDAYFARGGASAAHRAQIQLDLGRAFFNARQYPAAERRLRAALTAAAGVSAARTTAADAAYLLGRSQYRRNAVTEARATFTRVIRDYTGSTAAARAHYTLADIEHDANRLANARTHYRAVLAANGPDATLAAVRLGSLALVEGRARAAAELYETRYRRADTSPAERQQLGYWWAQSLQRAGAADSAQTVLRDVRALDAYSYYGMRAGELLEEDMPPLADAPAITPDMRTQVARAIDVIDILREAALTAEAAFEAARVAERHRDAQYALGSEYHARGQTATGVRIGRELLRAEGSWNRGSLQLVYPFPFREEITGEAAANGLDPYLVAGLIRQESMFNPRARSIAGALGLMQVMPQTGTRVANAMGMRSFTPAQLTDAAVNLRLGTRYLADQIRMHSGRVIDAVAAYNAGPHRVARWSAFPEYRDDDLFAERIPYQETRDYVKIVQQNARIYRELYGDDM